MGLGGSDGRGRNAATDCHSNLGRDPKSAKGLISNFTID